MYDVFSSVRTQLHTTNLSKGDAKVEVLGWYARICMFDAYLHTKNAPFGAL